MIGDSKSAAPLNSWPAALAGKFADSLGISGATVGNTAPSITSILAGSVANTAGDVQFVLCNLGVNDAITSPEDPTQKAAWISNYKTIRNAAHSKFPGASIRYMYPWRSAWTHGEADIMHSWIDELIADAPTYTASGPDEQIWFKPNVATYSVDGLHYFTAAGQAGCEAAWRSNLGAW